MSQFTVTPQMVQAGLSVLYDSGRIRYEMASDALLVREIFKSMVSVVSRSMPSPLSEADRKALMDAAAELEQTMRGIRPSKWCDCPTCQRPQIAARLRKIASKGQPKGTKT